MTHLFWSQSGGHCLLGWSLTAPVYADTAPTTVTGPTTQAPASSTPAQGQTPQGPKDKGGKKNSGGPYTVPPK